MEPPQSAALRRSPSPAEGRLFAGRFRAELIQKDSLGTTTWQGVDEATGRAVIIKVARFTSAAASLARRFEHEAGILQRMDSPQVVPLLDYGHEGAVHYLVMPFLSGTTLERRLGDGPLPLRHALAIARDVLLGLEALHENGVLHRDVKPANVIVDGGAPRAEDGEVTPHRATLIDIGLACSDTLDLGETSLPLGTARYLSPEQAGFLDREVGPESDLYALGAMLFECLAGAPPFPGDTTADVLRHHLVTQPPLLRTLGVRVPRVVDEMVHRLLRKDPRDRYQSAHATRLDVEAILDSMARGAEEPDIVVGAGDARTSVTLPAFIGRATELAALDEERARAGDAEPRLVLLEAESGGGKSRLLDEWAQRCRQQGNLVLSGEAVSQSASRPLEVMATVAETLAALVRISPELAASIAARLGDACGAVCEVLPELAPILGCARKETRGLEDHLEARGLRALAAFIDALGSPEAPAIIILDDCQWADEMTLKLLLHWRARPSPAHVLVVVAFRPEEVSAEHPLRVLMPSGRLIALEPFSEYDVARIAESAAGTLPPEVHEVVRELSAGNPFMVSAVLGGLVESGAIVSGQEGWIVRPDQLATVQSSRRAAVLLSRRIDALPANTRALLANGAVLGKQFDIDLAGALASLTGDETLFAHEEARRRHLVWQRPQTTSAVFVHDKIREALLAGLPAGRRRDLHRQAAAHLAIHAPDRVYELAYHYDAAREPEKALPYALSAGKQARGVQALELAERQYRIAERANAPDAETRRLVAEALGDILLLRGRYDEASKQLDIAQALSTDNASRAKIESKRGELFFKRGDVRQASVALERGLDLLGQPFPASRVALLFMAVWEIAVQVLHTLLPGRFLARRLREGADETFVAIRLYSRLAYASWCQRGQLHCLWAHLREMNIAETYAPSAELAQAYSEHAPVMTTVPFFRRAIEYAERSMVIRVNLGDVWGQGQSLHFHGNVLYVAGRFEEAREKCREAARLLERTGDRWEMNTANLHVAFCEYRLGNLASAIRLSRAVHDAGQAIGDHLASGFALGCWAKSTFGHVPQALIHHELERGGDDVTTYAEVLQAEALRLLSGGLAAEAVAMLERAHAAVRKGGVHPEYIANVEPWLAGALRAEACTPELAYEPGRRRALLSRAAAIARRARRTGLSYPNNLPHALRESGLIAALRGRPGQARAFLDRSLEVAERQNMKLERTLTLEARALVGRTSGWTSTEEDTRAASQLRRTIDIDTAKARPTMATEVVSLSLADRFPRVLDAGHRIATALSREAVLAAVRESALGLLRGERCVVLETMAASEPEPPSSRHGGLSATVVKRALATGRVVVMTEGLPGSDADSLVLSDTRSALCAPIFVRGRAAACFYVLHEDVGALFGPVEERLAEFIATIAGAALENTQGFDAVKELSEERRRLFAQAEQALGVRDDFLSVASHELRTPLTSLQLSVQLLMKNLMKDGGAATAHVARAAKIFDQSQRIEKLIDDLLDISRITNHKVALEPEDFDLTDLVREVAERLAERAMQAGCELRVSATQPVHGRWDRARLDQIVTNLCTNAIKFGAGKPIDLTVTFDARVGPGSSTGPTAILSVRDSGIGISAQDRERIFGRFERAVSVRHYGGFGLGLWIVRQIVEAMNGKISVESEPGAGSCFTVELPGVSKQETFH